MYTPRLSSQKRKRKREESEETEQHNVSHGYIDDDSEPHKFGTAVLPVANLPDTFDGVPQDGLEYLFTVRREERQLPLVTRVHNPYAVASAKHTDTAQLAHDKLDRQDSTLALPSEEWRACFEERFRNLRANIRQPTIHVKHSDPSTHDTAIMPEMRERDQWWAFFRGDVEWAKVPSSQFHTKKHGTGKARRETVGYDEELPTDQGRMRAWVVYDEQLSWDQDEATNDAIKDSNIVEEGDDEEDPEKNTSELMYPILPIGSDPSKTDNLTKVVGVGPREPTPELLSHLSQKVILHLLKYFTQWIQGYFDRSFLPAPPPLPASHTQPHSRDTRLYTLTPTHARWIFALLSHLDAQLTSDEISILRKLAREVIKVISEEQLAKKTSEHHSSMGKTSMGEKGGWMIVAAIVSIWGQKDLWMDAEEALQ